MRWYFLFWPVSSPFLAEDGRRRWRATLREKRAPHTRVRNAPPRITVRAVVQRAANPISNTNRARAYPAPPSDTRPPVAAVAGHIGAALGQKDEDPWQLKDGMKRYVSRPVRGPYGRSRTRLRRSWKPAPSSPRGCPR